LLSESGSIAMTEGAKLLPGMYIWMIDADGDGYPATLTEYVQKDAPIKGRRKYLMTSSTDVDCSETYFSTTNNCCSQMTWYRDVDGDGYGNPAGPTTMACAPVPSGYSANNTDCDDTSGNGSLVWASHSACYWDGDGDGYTAGNVNGNTCLNSSSCDTSTRGSLGGGAMPTTYVAGRIKNTASVTSDCNDALVLHNYTLPSTYYPDNDLDGFTLSGTSVGAAVCSSATTWNTSSSNSVPGVSVVSSSFTAGARKTASSAITDCKDVGTNANKVMYSGITCYLDSDNDDFGSTVSRNCLNSQSCATATYGSTGNTDNVLNINFAANTTDCGPTNASAYPGSYSCSSSTFINTLGNASYDYNCDNYTGSCTSYFTISGLINATSNRYGCNSRSVLQLQDHINGTTHQIHLRRWLRAVLLGIFM